MLPISRSCLTSSVFFEYAEYLDDAVHCCVAYIRRADHMANLNIKTREMECKIVFYGPGRGGKTTNLEYIFKTYRKQTTGEMISIKTKGDRTLFFDFLPLKLGKIRGYDVRVKLYTVPGQVRYDATRKVVLRDVDGLVFVADSLLLRREHNILSLQNLQKNLSGYGSKISEIPLILQYNKRDHEK